jgi:uncharacterized protein YegP (UPF0339 family)
MSYFVVNQSTDKQYYFNLKSDGNHETVLTSERYKEKASALVGIASVKSNAPLESQYARLMSGTQYYFNLKASNGQVIATSERYTTSAARETAIAWVKANAPSATTNS